MTSSVSNRSPDRAFAIVERALMLGVLLAAALAVASFLYHAERPATDAAAAGWDAPAILP
jgi:hypothetical protein